MLGRQLVAGHLFGVRLIPGEQPPDPHRSVVAAIDGNGVDFDPIPSVVGLDDHSGLVEPAGPLDLMASNKDGGEGMVGVVIPLSQPRCDGNAR